VNIEASVEPGCKFALKTSLKPCNQPGSIGRIAIDVKIIFNLIGVSMAIPEPRRDPENAEREMLKQHAIQPGGRVIDIGCGDGRLTSFFAQDASAVIGTDVDLEKLRSARMVHPNTVPERVEFIAARGEAMPFTSETFHLAVFSWSL
jgi:methylase of polypeptide subunit release factors